MKIVNIKQRLHLYLLSLQPATRSGVGLMARFRSDRSHVASEITVGRCKWNGTILFLKSLPDRTGTSPTRSVNQIYYIIASRDSYCFIIYVPMYIHIDIYRCCIRGGGIPRLRWTIIIKIARADIIKYVVGTYNCYIIIIIIIII